MSKQKRMLWISDLMLLAVAMIWGTSYGVVKGALAVYPVLGLLALRFGLTFIVLSPALRSLRHARAPALAGLLGSSVLLLGIFLSETFGISMTRASNAAFLISLCVVLTPLVEWALLRRKPSNVEWMAVVLSFAGATMVSGGVFIPTGGDALILLAALLRALMMCVTKRVMRESALAPLSVTAVQAGTVALGSLVVAAIAGSQQWRALPSLAGHGMFWASVAYLVLACTLFAFFAQNFAVKRSNPTRVALLMGSEPAFGALFAFVWLGERITVHSALGGSLMVLASLLAAVPWQRSAGMSVEMRSAVSTDA